MVELAHEGYLDLLTIVPKARHVRASEKESDYVDAREYEVIGGAQLGEYEHDGSQYREDQLHKH